MLAKGCVKEAVSSCILVGIAEGEFVANGVFLEEAKGVTNTDVLGCARKEARTIEVRPNHDEEVGAGAGSISLGACRGCLRLGTTGA